MIKREAQMQIKFGRWVVNRFKGDSALFELKRTLTKSLPLSSIKDHQLMALSQAANSGLFYKIPDDSVGVKPSDCFYLKNAEAYLVVAYGPKLIGFYLIPIAIVERIKRNGTVSITEKLAKEFGEYHEIPKAK